MTIAVVILNWNGKALLKQFLPSVIKHSQEAQIYVADNASTDGSVECVTTNFPSVKVIKNATNGGYAKGYNDALKNLKEDTFILLNSDVEVTKNWLTPLRQCLLDEPNTAILQPKLLDYKNKTYFEYAGAAGGFIDRLGYPYCRGRIFNAIEKDEGQYNDVKEIFWASGACLVIRRHVFEELNGLDEDFFAHQEEIDLCWRAKNLGYIIKYIGASEVYHVGGATLNTMNPKKTFYNFRNTLFALLKNVPSYNVWLLLFTRLCLDAIAFVVFLFEAKPKHALSILSAHFSFYKHLPAFIKKRKQIRKKARYSSVFSIVFSHFVLQKSIFQKL